jgi:hypothetical protein
MFSIPCTDHVRCPCNNYKIKTEILTTTGIKKKNFDGSCYIRIQIL